MEWIVVGILGLLLINFFSLYRKGLKERQCLVSFILQVLLDEEAYRTQKTGLRNLVLDLNAKDAVDLSSQANISVARLANQLGDSTLSASHSLLWRIKQGSGD